MDKARYNYSAFPINKVIADFIWQANSQLQANLRTQKVWPTEVYPGYAKKNAANKARGRSHSTGHGAKSLRARMVNVSSVGDLHLQVEYNDYMSYVDLGVGAGTKVEDVERNKKARYNRRYITVWNRKEGRSHRPAIMMETRHLAARIERYLNDFYGMYAPINIIKRLENSEFKINL